MGVSTDGEISFGFVLDDGVELPWDGDQHEGDVESWWREISGYKPPFELYDGNGNKLSGVTDAAVTEYYQHQFAWEKLNPVPVSLVNYCSGEYPMYAITVRGAGLSCCRGYPKEFDPFALVVTEEQIAALKEFCTTHSIEVEGEPKWMLTSYWG